MIKKHLETSSTPNADYVRSIFGNDAVLLPVKVGSKCPTFPGWQKLSLADTNTPKFKLIVPPKRDGMLPPRPVYYKVELEKGNIGILQGRPSNGLVSIDIDADDDIKAFLDINPNLANTLQTRGSRGCNFWFRVPCDPDTEIKSFDAFRNGVKVYEFRADGRQTVVFGRHPSGKNYEILNLAPVVSVDSFEIPEDAITESVSSKNEALKGLPLMSSVRLERRRDICENILGNIEWVSPSQGLVEKCPNETLHTTPSKLGDTWIFADGAATLHCFHTSCRQANSVVTQTIRDTISSSERLVLPDGVITRDQVASALFCRIADEQAMFCRSGQLVVEVSFQKGSHSENGITLSNINRVSAVSRFENYAQFCCKKVESVLDATTNTYKKVTTYPPKKISSTDAEEFLNTKAAMEILPPLDNISQCPIIIKNKDGHPEILSDGYHQDRATYINYNKKISQVTVAEAVRAIEDLGVDYKFSSIHDRMRFIASIFTPALLHGGHIEDFQTPVIVAEANAKGSGKTEIAKAISKIYNAVPYNVIKKSGGVGSLDESLNTGLEKGESYLLLDNLRGKMDSQFLESFITSKQKTPVRIPGKAEVIVDARNTIVFATSNGFEATPDLADRSLFINILKQDDDYEFEKGSLVSLIDKSNGYYLSCVFAILEEWIKRDCPTTNTKQHRMRPWARIVDSLLQEFFGYSDSLFDGHNEAQSVSSNSRLVWIVTMGKILFKEGLFGKEIRAKQLAELCTEEGHYVPNVPFSLRGDASEAAKYLGIYLKPFFKDGSVRTVGGYIFERLDCSTDKGPSHSYKVDYKTKNDSLSDFDNAAVKPEVTEDCEIDMPF